MKKFQNHIKKITILFNKKEDFLLYKICLVIFCALGFVSCQTKKDYNTAIDREKIDAAFGYNVSKLLFNHLYVVVDSTTYANLTQNKNWQDNYASLDEGLPDFSHIHDNSSTFYLRGHEHYIEILGPNNTYNEPVGKSGIGFSLKNKGEHFHLGVQPKIRTVKDSILKAHEIISMPLNTGKQTWFKAFYTPSSGTALHTWYGFYNPAFLDSLYKKNHEVYSRKVFLDSAYTKHKLFNGIKEIHLSCTSIDFKRIVQELVALDSKILKKDENTLIIISGDIKVKIAFSDLIKYSRITRIICELNNDDHSHTELGHLSITNKGLESIWDLTNLYKHNP